MIYLRIEKKNPTNIYINANSMGQISLNSPSVSKENAAVIIPGLARGTLTMSYLRCRPS